jgi:hypothetical protein
MAKRVFAALGQTFTAQLAGGANNLTNATYMGIQGGSATQIIDVLEVLISGMNTSSVVAAMILQRASTVAATPTALAAPNSDAGENPSITALVAGSTVIPFVAATTGPIADNTTTSAKLNLSLNTFGGIIRWNAAPTQQWWIVGSAATGGETLLWNFTTGGGNTAIANAHIIYEPY